MGSFASSTRPYGEQVRARALQTSERVATTMGEQPSPTNWRPVLPEHVAEIDTAIENVIASLKRLAAATGDTLVEAAATGTLSVVSTSGWNANAQTNSVPKSSTRTSVEANESELHSATAIGASRLKSRPVLRILRHALDGRAHARPRAPLQRRPRPDSRCVADRPR